MHKYAALTALAIVLSITMLVLAISASLTPANARCPLTPPVPASSLGMESYCICRCWGDAWRRHASTETPTTLWTMSDDKKLQACLSKCVNAFEASFHREIKTWSETR
jgi:hypothetical protein